MAGGEEEEFEHINGVIIRIRKSQDRQHNAQKKNHKRTKTTQKTKDRAAQIPLESGVNSCASEG